jgi:metal-responsive CopG/Arc/MetJ family transcriptional regulator
MEIDLTLPEPIFEASERLAAHMGVTRSELYTQALVAFLAEHADEQITSKLNEIYGEESSTLDPVFAQLQALSVSPEQW